MNWHPFLSLSSVMFLQFVPKTHLFFTAGKDKKIKQWDADKFVLIQTLEVCFYPSLISPLSLQPALLVSQTLLFLRF